MGDRTVVRLGLTGDVMLGRLVDHYVLADPMRDPAEIWGDTLDLFASADARLINLECVIAASGRPLPDKTFTFRARPRAIEVLRAAGVNFAGLANNHVLDYGPEALLECLDHLRAAGIAAAGAGRDLAEAAAPAVITAGIARVAVVALTDNEPGWEAGDNRPGVLVVRYDERGLVPPYRDRIAAALRRARETADVVVVCAHVGPNWGPPSPAMRALARQLLDWGGDLYWGHSNHSVQGIECYGDKVIIYSAGDFVDDYAVDPEERNDLSFFIEVAVRGRSVETVRLHPVHIEALRVRRAPPREATWLRRRMEALCPPMGTRVDAENGVLVLSPAASGVER
ncbi:MAG: CapA family protein [Armatimonadota bacterium]|nr:CapA family protein [Armatimonadota bacterium]MDR7450324.1 CapA family protein [Armatimonadota bacterium]MDR7467093.1 CapA family protein [Armatimonadota bacterium]MDR7493365.1 CapA family protein [Armatimonadota bacterium]MDR7499373.1 CapA family protein [Armatimonadota bacterium]